MKISISSSRKRGLTPDLRLVQKYLKNNIEDIEFSYFMADETSKNRMAKKGDILLSMEASARTR